MSANSIRKDLDELMEICDIIYDEGECDGCPLWLNCLREDTVEDIWSEVSESRIKDFIEYVDELDEIREQRKREEEQEQREYEEEMRELYRGWRADRGI